MPLVQRLISENKYGVKCPYTMVPKGICIHNTANDATAANEISYMQNNNNEVSFHIAIDDIEAIQGLPLNRNAWHAGDGGNGEGNRNYIAIEICYSKSGGLRFINAEKRAAKEIAALLKQYGWTINNIKKHQDFSNKYCPQLTLDLGWQRFLNMVQAELNLLNGPVKPTWKQDKIGWWYDLGNSKYPTNKWMYIEGEYYYFNKEGYALSKQWLKYNNSWYYFLDNCYMAKGQWIKDNGKWYYILPTGKMATEDVYVDGKWYTVKLNGEII